MIDKNKLRGSDLVSGMIFLVLGLYIIFAAFQMPLNDSYGGVESHWYVSPALMPLIIGFGMILLSVSIIVNGLKNGGKIQFLTAMEEKRGTPFLSEDKIRFAAVMVPLIGIVFVNLKAIDFYLNTVMYLLFTTGMFYFEDDSFLKKGLIISLISEIVIGVLHFSSVDDVINSLFFASMDIIAIVSIVVMSVSIFAFARRTEDGVNKKKARQIMLVSFLTPLFIVPLFKFALRVPMPKEGIVVNLMSMIYYALR